MKIFGYEIRKATNNEIQVPQDYTNFGDALLFGNLRNNFGALQLSCVFRCTDLISDSIASLPINIKKEENYISHSLLRIFKSGLNHLSYSQFIKQLIQSVILKGNGYALIQRANDGTVIGLRFVQAGDVQIHYNKSMPSQLYYTCNLIQNKKIEPCNIIHLRRWSDDGINGKSIIDYADRTLRLAHSCENSATQVFNHGMSLSGIITVDGNIVEKQRQNIHQSWQTAMQGGGDGIAVFPGNMHYQPVQTNSKDSQLLESRQFQVEDICRFFGIAPALLGIESFSGSLEAAQIEFLVHTLQPYINMIEQEFTKKLFKPSEPNHYVEIDENQMLRTDKQGQASYYNALLQTGVLSINEVREELGYQPIDGGDAHIIPFTDINQNKINNGIEE